MLKAEQLEETVLNSEAISPGSSISAGILY